MEELADCRLHQVMVKRLSSLSQTGPIHDCSVSNLMHIYMVKYGKPFFLQATGWLSAQCTCYQVSIESESVSFCFPSVWPCLAMSCHVLSTPFVYFLYFGSFGLLTLWVSMLHLNGSLPGDHARHLRAPKRIRTSWIIKVGLIMFDLSNEIQRVPMSQTWTPCTLFKPALMQGRRRCI